MAVLDLCSVCRAWGSDHPDERRGIRCAKQRRKRKVFDGVARSGRAAASGTRKRRALRDMIGKELRRRDTT